MSEPVPEILCETCTAACCKAPMSVMLTRREHKQHGAQMGLEEIEKPRSYNRKIPGAGAHGEAMALPAEMGWYKFQGPCGNLDDENRCSIYTRRPNCCRLFEMGSPACRKARRDAGLDVDLPIFEEEAGPEVAEGRRRDALVKEFFRLPVTAAIAEEVTPQPDLQVKPLTISETRSSFERDAHWLVEQLDRCDATTWLRPTRCTEWNVGQLAEHLVSAMRHAHSVLQAALNRTPAQIPPDFTGDRRATAAAFKRESKCVSDALSRLQPATLATHVLVGGGDVVNVQEFLEDVTLELAAHSSDLAHALSETHHFTTEAVRAVARVLPEALHPGMAAPKGMSFVLRSLVFEIPFTWHRGQWTNEVGQDPCCIEGEPEAVLLFALGRADFDEARLSSNRPDQARSFKRHLRGP